MTLRHTAGRGSGSVSPESGLRGRRAAERINSRAVPAPPPTKPALPESGPGWQTPCRMTPAEFITKWQASTRNERAACQEHFIDLCRLLDEPTPNSDATGDDYAFEKGATKFTGEGGWADVWRRGCFAWEYKKKRGDLDAAHRQLLLYAGPLGNPPLLIVSDIARIVIRTNWTNAVTETHTIPLAELADPKRLRLLKWAFSDPDQLRPARTRQALTEEAAGEFAKLAGRLRDRGHDPLVVAHFVNRLVFCLFADDVGLLPAGLFVQLLARARQRPDRSERYASDLFAAMAESGGEIGYTPIPWFNGGLFDDATALPLDRDDIDLLIRTAKLDWAEIDPSLLGTLFERGLNPGKRSQLGAHYTDRDKIDDHRSGDPPAVAGGMAGGAGEDRGGIDPAGGARAEGDQREGGRPGAVPGVCREAAPVPRAGPRLRVGELPVSEPDGAEGPGAPGRGGGGDAGIAAGVSAGRAGNDAGDRDQ
jgi:hypothetical protein